MPDRSVSVPMILSDLERPDAWNHFFQADLNNAGQVSHVIAFAQMRRAVCQRQLMSFLLKADRESLVRTVCGSDFQTDDAENRKARLEKSVLVNGWTSSGTADERMVGLQTRFTFRRPRKSVLAYGPERKTIERNTQLKQSFTTSCVSRKLNAVGSIAASVTSQQTRIKHTPVSQYIQLLAVGRKQVFIGVSYPALTIHSFSIIQQKVITFCLFHNSQASLSAKNYSILMHNFLDRLSYQQTYRQRHTDKRTNRAKA